MCKPIPLLAQEGWPKAGVVGQVPKNFCLNLSTSPARQARRPLLSQEGSRERLYFKVPTIRFQNETLATRGEPPQPIQEGSHLAWRLNMRRTVRIALSSIAAAATVLTLHGTVQQQPQAANRLIAVAAEALGGRERILAVKTIVLEG